MSKPDGGNAFPIYAPDTADGEQVFHPGMSLRAWLAGMAMRSIIARGFSGHSGERGLSFHPAEKKSKQQVAAMAVAIADSMLAELEKD